MILASEPVNHVSFQYLISIKVFVDWVDSYLNYFIYIIFRTNMKLIDESETDIDDENQTVINNVHDYHSVFKPNRTCKYSYFYLMVIFV